MEANFKNRKSQYPNRRKITIVKQSANEMVADIVADEGLVEEAGTAITAEIMNQIITNVNSSVQESGEAKQTANIAKTTADEAKTESGEAKQLAQTALNNSQTALEKANAVERQVVQGLGTIVTVGGQNQQTFNADSKADATALSNEITARQESCNQLSSELTSEKQSRQGADDLLSQRIENLTQGLSNSVNTNKVKINNWKLTMGSDNCLCVEFEN